MRGLILLAHGARDPLWARPFEEVSRLVRLQRPDVEVRNAYLEFMTPDLATAGRELAGLGCLDVDVLPVFLGAGGHVRKDVPAQLQALEVDCPGVTWQLQATVGESPALLQAIARIATALVP
jgi:sirohydrochlorin cobaltochelatase